MNMVPRDGEQAVVRALPLVYFGPVTGLRAGQRVDNNTI